MPSFNLKNMVEVNKQYGQAIENKDHKIVGFILFDTEAERIQKIKALDPSLKCYGVVFSQRIMLFNNC